MPQKGPATGSADGLPE